MNEYTASMSAETESTSGLLDTQAVRELNLKGKRTEGMEGDRKKV